MTPVEGDRAPFWPFLGEGFWGNIRQPLVLPAPLFSPSVGLKFLIEIEFFRSQGSGSQGQKALSETTPNPDLLFFAFLEKRGIRKTTTEKSKDLFLSSEPLELTGKREKTIKRNSQEIQKSKEIQN